LHKLPDFFFKRHLAQQAIHARFDVWIGELGIRWVCGYPRIVFGSWSGSLSRRAQFASDRY
jgi:hypothetical protein